MVYDILYFRYFIWLFIWNRLTSVISVIYWCLLWCWQMNCLSVFYSEVALCRYYYLHIMKVYFLRKIKIFSDDYVFNFLFLYYDCVFVPIVDCRFLYSLPVISYGTVLLCARFFSYSYIIFTYVFTLINLRYILQLRVRPVFTYSVVWVVSGIDSQLWYQSSTGILMMLTDGLSVCDIYI